MRKLTLEFEPYETTRESLKPMFKQIHSFEILEMLKIDYEEGICVDLIEVHLKEGVSIHDIEFIGNMEILSILKSVGDKHICLIKYREPEESRDMFRDTDLDLIMTTPSIVSEERITTSFIGENENLARFVEMVKTHVGSIVNMSFKRAVYQKHDILSILTEKQRNIIIAAQKHGYYDYPKKISSDELSKKVDLSKATTLQHLRKAEGRIMENIVAGFSLK